MGSKAAYQVSEQWLGQPRPVRVVLIGAGIGGIAAVKLFNETFKDRPTSLVIYEKNHDVGGTWLENRYPGCSCDIPAHGYTYSWEGNPSWSKPYVGSEELFEYFKGRAQAYGVFEHVHFKHRVIEARWNGSIGRWQLKIENSDSKIIEDECEVLINAGGFLNKWKWPDIKGIDTYKGFLVHSAAWDPNYSFKGKTVAVIGSGSSAIQIVPIIQKQFASEFAPEGRDSVFSEEQRAQWIDNPNEFLKFRKEIENSANQFFNLQFKDTPLQEKLYQNSRETMEKRLNGKKELASKLVPTFAVGCRRMTPGHGYLEALASDNVVVRSDAIARITPTGIEMVDGTQFTLDAIICATGFDNSYRPSFTVIGENGKELREEWKDEPRSYLSVAVAGYPNYFMATGPNFPLSNGSLIACLEETLKYAFKAVDKIQSQGVKSLSPTRAAVDDFQEHKDAMMEQLVWTSSCRSWYKNGTINGKVWGPYPGSVPHFFELLGVPRWEDYNIEYKTSNRFQYLGKGKTYREVSGGDLSWYVTEPGANLAA
ncbi:fad nadp-binding domain-containing [Trichoderma arundinaceum]|uniref:Fad nadp-binding domain-containing n=1 Tax=Trichoderma arundinaceum TaxID=490622 RepID=A0A395P1V6_TRIAR|nr:fad nadp-binding domain-containing [Trichoderma arundinaceum]